MKRGSRGGWGTSFIVLDLLLRQGNRGIDLLPGVLLGFEQGRERGKAVLYRGSHPTEEARQGPGCQRDKEGKGEGAGCAGWGGGELGWFQGEFPPFPFLFLFQFLFPKKF